MDKKTILQINVDANNGSNGSIARDIGTLVLARGWNSYIAYGRRHIPCDSTLIRVGNDWDVRWHGLESRLFDNHGLSSRIVTKLFLNKVDHIKPDIIHLHNIHGYYINYKYLFEYISSRNIHVVWTMHDLWPMTGHCAYPILYKCDRFRDGCHNCQAKSGYPKSIFFNFAERNFDIKNKMFTLPSRMVITTVSQWLKNETTKGFLNKYPIEVIYDGIDTDSFKPVNSELREKYNLKDKFILLAAAANWSISKGWNDYITLASHLPKDHVIMLVGVSEEKAKELPANIIPIPRVESKENLAQYYSMADILLNLSYAETFGMTTAEAMACGTPGISYNRTACPEVLSEDTGIIVEPGNIEQVVAGIESIKERGKYSYSEKCRQRVLDNFDFKKVNQKFLNIYDDLLRK